MTDRTTDEKLQQIAKNALDGIVDIYKAWQALNDGEESVEYNGNTIEDLDDMDQIIFEDPLSVQFRSGWTDYGADMVPEEFNILLSWGGPATRIMGDLGEHNIPENIRIEAQDWFTPWVAYTGTTTEEDEALEWYCERIVGCI